MWDDYCVAEIRENKIIRHMYILPHRDDRKKLLTQIALNLRK